MSFSDKLPPSFSSGDIVKLKSGSPAMTVHRVVDYNAACHTDYKLGVHVDWCDELGVPHFEVFNELQLEKVVTSPPPRS